MAKSKKFREFMEVDLNGEQPEILPLQIKSGVFEIRPNKLLYLKAGGSICVTPKKTYKAFLTTNDQYPLVIVLEKDNRLRYFPVLINYAKNNFSYQSESTIPNQRDWLDQFNSINEHIRKNEKIFLKNV